MIKLIQITLTPAEFLPLQPLVNNIPYESWPLSKTHNLQIVSYLSAIAMMKHGILPEDVNKPKRLTNFEMKFDLRKQKYTYKATLAIEIPENGIPENEDDPTIS